MRLLLGRSGEDSGQEEAAVWSRVHLPCLKADKAVNGELVCVMCRYGDLISLIHYWTVMLSYLLNNLGRIWVLVLIWRHYLALIPQTAACRDHVTPVMQEERQQLVWDTVRTAVKWCVRDTRRWVVTIISQKTGPVTGDRLWLIGSIYTCCWYVVSIPDAHALVMWIWSLLIACVCRVIDINTSPSEKWKFWGNSNTFSQASRAGNNFSIFNFHQSFSLISSNSDNFSERLHCV